MTGRVVLEYAADGALRRAGRGGEAVAFTATEARFWEALIRVPGAVVSADRLMSELYADAVEEPFQKILGVFAANIRRKLGRIGAREALETVRGRGYALNVAAGYEVRRAAPVLHLALDPALIDDIREAAFQEGRAVEDFAAAALRGAVRRGLGGASA